MHILFQTIPQLAKELSSQSMISRVRICLQFWYFAITRRLFKVRSEFPVSVSFSDTTFTLYLRYDLDLAVLKEIYIDKEYEWCPATDPKVILDLGAHFGDTSLYYSIRFPEAKIIAVEPSPENYERLVKHSKAFPNIIPVNAAVGSSDGEIKLNLMPGTLGHSVMQRKESKSFVTVQKLSLSSLYKQNEIKYADLIKFDIEGAEFDLFSDMNPNDFAAAYVGELHYDLADVQIDLKNIFKDYIVNLIKIKKDRFLFFAKK